MSRRQSRLHTLERSVRAPRPRAKARALTIMRLEGSGATGVQTNTRPATLPKDMEDQIAVVRGRAPGKPSRGLLQLEERLLRPRDVPPASSAIQRHGHDAMPAPAASVPTAPGQAASFAFGASGESYNVEPFEDASAMFSGAAVGLPRTQYHASTTAVPVKTEPYSPASMSAAQSLPPVPWSGANSFADDDAWMSQRTDRSSRERALNSEQMAVAANFERDVAAMLGSPAPATAPEDNQWNNTLLEATKTASAPPATAPPPVKPPETAAAPSQNTHEVFNQMGMAMNYANSFDLGAMDLSARFDRFEEELALAPKARPTPAAPARIPVQALALDDFDLVADLAEISGALSAATAPPAPAVEAPSDPPITSQEQAATPAG